MGLRDKIEEYAEKEVQTRMRPAVEAMNRLEQKISELIYAIEENTRVIKEGK